MIDTEKAFEKKKPTPFIIKPQHTKNRKLSINLTKGIYQNPTVNIMLNAYVNLRGNKSIRKKNKS